LVRKCEERSSSSRGEEPNNCAIAHCCCNNASENFDRHVIETLCQNYMYSRQDCFQDSLALKALAFRAVCCWPDSESRTEPILASDSSSSFRISEATPDGFSWLVKNRAYFGSAQSTQLLEVFFARTELLALGVVHSPVLVGQKRDRDKTRVVLCSCAEFLLSADPSSLKSNSFLICSLEIGFLWTTPAMMPVFLRPFTNVLIIYLPGQR